MITALAERQPEGPIVTSEQLELVKNTVAQGATDAELKLYLYDCARHGVHPLDKLLHFTKRKGRYVPITSIDLMRIRAAETGDCLGISDPHFGGTPMQPGFEAMVSVYRLVQGQRAEFQATARWTEYYPGDGDPGFMWRKMPHTMLGKCAEALALRKGFPKQLAGLYAREEMDQASEGSTDIEKATVKLTAAEQKTRPPAPAGAVYLDKVIPRSRGNQEWAEVILSSGVEIVVRQPQLITLAMNIVQENVPAVITTHRNTKGNEEVDLIERWKPDVVPVLAAPEPTAKDIAF